ncbi:MAG: hypothetical protein HOV80_19795 [Polyangiaceae bacterium]|nr:hypothetical protein [Polyangiaceae bacterium]
MRSPFILALSVASFLAAAKAHGRQLRLERELAGHLHVTFGAPNAPFVEALWRRERLVFWSLAATLALGAIVFRLLAPRFAWELPVEGAPTGRSFVGVLFLHILGPLTIAFVVTGLISLGRLLVADRSAAAVANPQHWSSQAVWGSAGFWLLTFALCTALSVLVWRRP